MKLIAAVKLNLTIKDAINQPLVPIAVVIRAVVSWVNQPLAQLTISKNNNFNNRGKITCESFNSDAVYSGAVHSAAAPFAHYSRSLVAACMCKRLAHKLSTSTPFLPPAVPIYNPRIWRMTTTAAPVGNPIMVFHPAH
jgi:hypothetical protein